MFIRSNNHIMIIFKKLEGYDKSKTQATKVPKPMSRHLKP